MKRINLLCAMASTLLAICGVAYGESTTVSVMQYEQGYFDLETGTIIECDFVDPYCENRDDLDFKFAYNSNFDPHAVIFQNQCVGSQCEQGVEIAYSEEEYSDVSWNDIEFLEFTRDLIDIPFTKIAVLKTPEGNYFKMGLLEDNIACDNDLCVRFKWEQLLSPIACNCPDSDGDGVPDVWDQCPDTPTGSCTNKQGCFCEGLYTEEQMNQIVKNILTWGDTNNDGKIGLAEAIHALL